jgi:phenylacetate-CoA ligase
VIFKLRHFTHPIEILRFRRFLEASQWWPRERLEAWRRARLLRTLDHAFTEVPHFRALARERGLRAPDVASWEGLRELPFLDRDDVVRLGEKLHARHPGRHEAIPSETSGSTGTPMRFLLDRSANVLEFSSLWRVLNWTGYRFGQRFASFSGRVLAEGRLWEHDWRLNCLHVSTFDFKRDSVPSVVERLRRFEPRVLKGYPSSLSLLARWIEETGVEAPRPAAVLCGSETLLDVQRDVLARVFKCPVHDFYGQNERAALASTCPRGRLHVHEEYSHVELLDDEGRPVPPGTAGHVVTTSFHNLAMPLIRYRTRDLAVESREPCPCGRPHRTLERVLGRAEDVVVTPDGRHVGRLDAAFKYAAHIRSSQVVQETVDALVVRIVRAEGYRGEVEEPALERHLRDRVGSAIRIQFEYVDRIAAGRNGKIKFVVSKVAPQYQTSAAIDLGRVAVGSS